MRVNREIRGYVSLIPPQTAIYVLILKMDDQTWLMEKEIEHSSDSHTRVSKETVEWQTRVVLIEEWIYLHELQNEMKSKEEDIKGLFVCKMNYKMN